MVRLRSARCCEYTCLDWKRMFCLMVMDWGGSQQQSLIAVRDKILENLTMSTGHLQEPRVEKDQHEEQSGFARESSLLASSSPRMRP